MGERGEDAALVAFGEGSAPHRQFRYRCEVGPHNFTSSKRHVRCLWNCEDDSELYLLVDPERAFAVADIDSRAAGIAQAQENGRLRRFAEQCAEPSPHWRHSEIRSAARAALGLSDSARDGSPTNASGAE